ACGGRRVAEQRAHPPALDARQQVYDRLPAFVRQLEQEVNRIVRLHPGEQGGDVLVPAILEELALMLRLELLEEVGLEIGIAANGVDDLLALMVRRGLDEVGELRRVQSG